MNTALATAGTFNLAETIQLGDILAHSGFFSDSREAAQAVAKIMAGAELGIPPVAAMTGIYIVKGRVTLSANLMAACIKRSGIYTYRVSWSDNGCRIEFFERGESIGVSDFGATEQKRAGLGGDVWNKFPRNMWFARAMSNGAKWYCADVFAGPVYTPDELGENVTEEGEIVQQAPRPTPPPEPVKQLAASPPTHRVLTPDPAAARAKLWKTFDAVVREAKTLGLFVKDAEVLQATEDASEAEVIEMGKALREAINLHHSINNEHAKRGAQVKAARQAETDSEDEDTGSFVEVVENVELFPNGVPA